MNSRLWTGGLVILMACNQGRESVQMRGVVTDGPESSLGLSGATVTTIGEDGEVYASTQTTSTGAFSVDLPAEQMVHALVEADGYELSSFSGGSGALAGLNAEVGLLFGVSDEQADDWRTDFEGCPGIGDGTMLIGQMKLLDMVSTTSGDPIVVTTGWAKIEDVNGNEVFGCYMDYEGKAYDSKAVETGLSGRFAIFGIDEGLYTMTVGYTLLYFEVYEVSWQMYAPGIGVAPRLPIWVESVL